MKKTASKKVLLASTAALSLSVLLYAGTTYAWFTDSVSSDTSTIQSGNLDLTVEVLNNGKWQSVEGTDIFNPSKATDTSLWEPGHVETAYLKITNAGTLSLKYELNLATTASTFTSVTEKQTDLSEWLYYGIQTSEQEITPYTERAQALAAMTVKDIRLTNTDPVYSTDLLKPTERTYIALTVYMPETVGNDANWNGVDGKPEISFTLHATATQTSDEADSYGNDYDASVALDRADLFIDRGYTPIANTVLAPTDFSKPIVLTGPVTKNGTQVISDCVLEMNGQTMTPITDWQIKGDGSPVTVSLSNGTSEITNAYGAVVVWPSGTSADVTFENMTFASAYEDTSHPGYYASRRAFCYKGMNESTATITFKNCVFDETYNDFKLDDNCFGDVKIVFENCTFNDSGSVSPIYLYQNLSGTLTLKDCTFNLTSRSGGNAVKAIADRGNKSITVTLEGENTINGKVISDTNALYTQN